MIVNNYIKLQLFFMIKICIFKPKSKLKFINFQKKNS